MALALGVRRGSKIKVGDIMLRVVSVEDGGKELKIEVGKTEFIISDEERTEILPDVFVSCGVYDNVITNWDMPEGYSETHSRLTFEAPTSIPIHRIKPPKH
jgi:sRNA-binding carbon storage regulator CsrA